MTGFYIKKLNKSEETIMKKRTLLIVGLLATVSLTSCSLLPAMSRNSNKEQQSEPFEESNIINNDIDDFEKQTREIYKLYLANGGTMSYEEWLATIKGEKGDKGDPGQNGQDGANGKDGSALLTGYGAPSDSQGNIGDSYIDLNSWNYYIKYTNGWRVVGNIKGEKGDDGNSGSGNNPGQIAWSNTILPSEHGYVAANVGSAIVGEEVVFTAFPDDGYELDHIYLNSTDYINNVANNTLTVPMVEHGYVVKAIFTNAITLWISETSASLTTGSSLQLSAYPSEYAGYSYTWSSSNPNIATVDENGVVTGVDEGSTIITVTYGRAIATCCITVLTPYLQSISLTLAKKRATVILFAKWRCE